MDVLDVDTTEHQQQWAKFVNIFMFHFGRCGSTALADAMSRIPGLFWHGEIFSEDTWVNSEFDGLGLSKLKGLGRFECPEFLDFISAAKQGMERDIGQPIGHNVSEATVDHFASGAFKFSLDNALSFLASRFRDSRFGFLMRRNGVQRDTNYSFMHYGCEIKGYHFEYGYFNFSLDNALSALAARFPDSKFIFLKRRNSLRRIISSTIAHQTGVYHVKTSVGGPNKFKIDLDSFADIDLHCHGEITAVLRHSISVENRYAETILRHGGFEICYEDHIEGSMNGAMDLLSEKLKVERVSPETLWKKTNPYPLSEMIENYDELRQRLLAANMERFLDE